MIQSIRESQIFSSVIEGQNKGEDYLLRVTLFSIDKRTFGRTVKLEAGWTLERADTRTIAWQEAILSEFTEANVQVATEGAARNNIAQGLAKIGKLIFNESRAAGEQLGWAQGSDTVNVPQLEAFL